MSELTISEALRIALDYHNAGRIAEAAPLYERIIQAAPQHADAIHLLGVAYFQANQPQRACELIERALAIDSKTAVYHNNYGQVLERLGRPQDAASAYHRAIELDPKYPEPRNNLGNVLEREDKFPEAVACYLEAIRLNPRYAEPHINLGNVFKETGDLDQAIANYRIGIELRPHLSLMHSNLLLTLHYHLDYSPADLAREHRAWADRHAAPFASTLRPHPNSLQPSRRLRIGYVSPDFRDHAVARFLLPLLEQHNRKEFEIYAYSDVQNPDAVTAKLKSHVDKWRDVIAIDEDALANAVRADRIDILVDLAAHTARTRLLAFARKPAPVQITYLAYCSTTGLPTMDYRISDIYLDPPDTDLSHYVEKTIRLPETYWCYSTPEVALEIGPLPALTKGRVTFGCLNNFCKVTDATLALWGQLLAAIPDAHLLLHVRMGDHRRRVLDHLGAAGVDPARIEFVGKQPFGSYMATYHRIDIGLDPIPFNGGTTTCDAMWMGVPVITLKGATAVARGGNSLLSNLGLPELIAETSADYVRIAADLAGDLVRLGELRRTLRTRMQNSLLMDAPRFTRNLESAYREMWRAKCNAA